MTQYGNAKRTQHYNLSQSSAVTPSLRLQSKLLVAIAGFAKFTNFSHYCEFVHFAVNLTRFISLCCKNV